MEPDNRCSRTLLDQMYCGVFFTDTERRITYWNAEAERITGHRAAEVIGAHCRNVLSDCDDNGSTLCYRMCPMHETLRDGRPRESEMHLRHKDGHRVAVSARLSPTRDARGRVIGAVMVFAPSAKVIGVVQRTEAFQQLAVLDPETGVANRRFVEFALRNRIEALHRFGWPFGVIVIHVDGLAAVRCTEGDAVANAMAQLAAGTLSGVSRTFDVLGRWTDDMFVVIIENATQEHLFRVARRYRALVEKSTGEAGGRGIQATVSVGGTLATPDDSVATLLERAERLSGESATAGGNRVAVAAMA